MRSITEKGIQYDFGDGWTAQKYDEWSFYRKQFGKIPNTKAVDIVAVGNRDDVWLIEVKDYRHQERESFQNLPDTIAHKMRDTLGGLLAARFNANDQGQCDFARQFSEGSTIHVVFHMEQYRVPSRIRPRRRDAANIQQKLRQLVKSIDAHASVGERNDLQEKFGWTITG